MCSVPVGEEPSTTDLAVPNPVILPPLSILGFLSTKHSPVYPAPQRPSSPPKKKKEKFKHLWKELWAQKIRRAGLRISATGELGEHRSSPGRWALELDTKAPSLGQRLEG